MHVFFSNKLVFRETFRGVFNPSELPPSLQVAGLDAVVVPVSGGGMSAGIALATKAINPSCKIILTAPEVLSYVT